MIKGKTVKSVEKFKSKPSKRIPKQVLMPKKTFLEKTLVIVKFVISSKPKNLKHLISHSKALLQIFILPQTSQF